MRGLLAAAAVTTLVAWGVACSEKSAAPTNPEPGFTNVAGTWIGAITVGGDSARMTWTLSQNNAAVTGPVLVSLTSGIVLLNGFLTGTLTGNSLAYTISVGPGGIPRQPTCVGQLTGTMNVSIGATSTLTGPMTVSSSTCTVPITNASITLTRS